MNRIAFPVKLHMRGQKVADLQDALATLLDRQVLLKEDEAAGRELAAGLELEREARRYGRFTRELVSIFQRERRLEPTGAVDEATANLVNSLLEELQIPRPAAIYQVEGRVASRVTASVGALRVVVVDKSVGGDVVLCEATTDRHGIYRASFSERDRSHSKEKPDLQARVFSGERFVAASPVRYDASSEERNLDVRLDDKVSGTLRSEHETLVATLSDLYPGDLRDLQESDERQDISYLANKSGWDARAVALAALADRFSARATSAPGDTGIEPAFFYAAFRAGLATDEEALYRMDPRTIERVWKQALKQGIIPAGLEERLPAALEQYQGLATRQLLEGPPPAGISSFQEILRLTLDNDDESQQQVASLYSRHLHDPAGFWEATKGALGEATADSLKLNGQLAYLTLNNAPLIKKLHAAVGSEGLRDSSKLVEKGFYHAGAWKEVVADDAVPPEIRGKDVDQKRKRYADLLAAQVRLSFPTAVVAEMVKSGETAVGSAELQEAVHNFLTQNAGKFEIGVQPVAKYLADHSLQVSPEVTQAVSRIQRVYQITPDDEALNGLLKKEIDSAQAVVRYGRDEFVRAFKKDVGGEQNALLIHAKAQQVHAAVLNIAVSFLSAKSAPGMGVHSLAPVVSPAPSAPTHADDVLAYGALEGLFGEMDFCTCEHCRSVLSPAAYMVDLLQFIDRPSSEVPSGATNPQTVLLERRPDIQHLPLTCANTNTPVPYIDLVNETLEHYVANDLSLSDTTGDPNISSEYTGHNTDGSVEPEDLLASPQFVTDAAYALLAGEHFPPPLPFHEPLENLRHYFRRFEAPLPTVMEDLRKDDSLERPSPAEYGWRDIWMETLGLSRAEHHLLTQRWMTAGVTDVMLTVKKLYGFDPATADTDVREVLDSAKSLCHRIGISYEELVEILKTRFVNPNSHYLPRLERLGVAYATLKEFKDGTISDAQFDDLVAPGLDPSNYGGDIKAWVKDDDNYARIMNLLTLTLPGAGEDVCDFDKVELCYANPDTTANRPSPFEFVRIVRFIRLWKKLGWTIGEVDKVLAALYPVSLMPDNSNDAKNLELFDAGLLALLPSLGVVVQMMSRLKLDLKKDLPSLLVCFSPIDTHGESSLFRRMFLGPSARDVAFAEDGTGEYLTNASEKLLDHSETLRAAFSLAADEFEEIASALAYDASTVLTLDNVSAVFRRGWLARKLQLSVKETLLLTQLTGYNPFGTPNPVAPAVLHLIEFVGRLRALGVKPTEALYLIWNRDLSGKSVPAEREVTSFARTMRGDLSAIESEFAVADDPDGSISRARMALVYGNDATDLFFGLLENTLVSEVDYSHGKAKLEQLVLDAAPGRIGYDDFKKRLFFLGVLTTVARDSLKAVSGVTLAFKDAVDGLYDENQKVVAPFFDRFPELQPLYDAFTASGDPVEVKRTKLLEAFVPELKRRRKRQQSLQSVAAVAGADVELASALLEQATVLHAAGDPARPALDDLSALESAGLATRFFYAPTASGTPDLTRDVEATLDYAASGSNSLPPNATTPGASISGIWTGYLEAPENGFYNLWIDTDASAAVTFALAGTSVALSQNVDGWKNTDPIELRAGTLYAISITVENVKNRLAVRWQTAKNETDQGGWGRGREVIPARYLYSGALVDNLRHAYARFLKAAALSGLLKVTAAEMVHFAAEPSYNISGEGWLNHLSVTPSPGSTSAATLHKAFASLMDFSRMKAELSPGDERLLEVLRNPIGATADPDSLLYALARWDKDSVDALLDHFGKAAGDLARIETLQRVFDACGWTKKLSIPSASLIEATTNDPTASAVGDFQASLRARYDESTWLEVLKPINDELRTLRRDALVAHILHRMRSDSASEHIDTAEKLFEYFLMDVQIDPCMLTSRIRNALSSIQLFIERCLMNLETRVSPASIKAKQWEWMKRYRVWEANRKVFLWPENWLEPELRDDQSPFFKEAMSELLQGDITEDRAAAALVGYLTKLEDVAKLEICGVHYQENQAGISDDVLHVIARTAGANRKYFYRRREYGSWTPWDRVSLDIEDNPVLPVVWKSRLFLFWLKLVQETEKGTPATPDGDKLADVNPSQVFSNKEPKLVVKAILNWSEFLDGKWQPARTSDPAKPLLLGTVSLGAVPDHRAGLRLAALFWPSGGVPDGALRIIVSYKGWEGSSFFLYNTFSTPELREGKKVPHFTPRRSVSTAKEPLTITYPEIGISHSLLENSIADRSVAPHHPLGGNPWLPPFFYEDSRHVFCVTTDQRLVPLSEWAGLGVFARNHKPPSEIPGLMLKQGEVSESPPIARQPGFGVVDPSPLQRYVTEDAYINAAIGSPGTVAFDDKVIGPAGSR